ncbi:restriction endonuclease [Methanolobus mangrovi]|uniref:Restriction endonuclease n=1 Tax=Methanolobus mangrovi TaxID=3072977 RepID=A0AA51UEL4_9EURY|nr:restriction endonuclease [Methanolobus mangrovi]WMW21794.1 restriction endonuclease [Methanolobus mangrovi]
MLPFLRYASDECEHHKRDAIEALAIVFNLSDSERKELLPSGKQAIFDNRVGWARTYLKKAGLIDSKKRGYFFITKRGLDVLSEKPDTINVNYLSKFNEFNDFINTNNSSKVPLSTVTNEELDPEELIENNYLKLHEELISEMLDTIKDYSPSFFEKLVVDVLTKIGYGGSRKDAGQAIGKSGDGGIDGIIKEDRLGLDVIYIQAKRWENTVGRPEIQKFAGALIGKRAKKGVFITTANFSKEAEDYAKQTGNIVLIDGSNLAKLMIEYNVGVSTVKTYDVKKIDLDYFDET